MPLSNPDTFLAPETDADAGAAGYPGQYAVGSSGAIGEYDTGASAGAHAAPTGGFRPAIPEDATFAFGQSEVAPASLFDDDPEADTLFVSGNSADEGGGTFISGNTTMEVGDAFISGNSAIETGDGLDVVGGTTSLG